MLHKKKRVIDLDKGKRLYYEYYGNKFGMYYDLKNEYVDCNVPEEVENEWKTDILIKLETEILIAEGSDLQVAVSRYMYLLPAEPEWLILLLQTRNIDTFTAIIFCEQLKDIARRQSNKRNYILNFLAVFKVKLLNEPITIHETYTNAVYMQNYDFSNDNITARINAI